MDCGCDDVFNPHRAEGKAVIACTKNRHHISLKGADSALGQKDLQELFDFLKNEHVAKHLLPTDQFKAFMAKSS